MNAFEFQAKPKNGSIEIPAEYKDKIVGTVRVIVLSQGQRVSTNDTIARLLANPVEMENFAPLMREEVYERR